MRILDTCVCPHCWSSFPPEDVLWIAAHAELLGDLRLGPEHAMRFLPSRFNAQGNAIDARGFACNSLACPRCHLFLPRAFLEAPPYFVSVLGAPASGKSFYLTALVWQLRRTLHERFNITFLDIDPQANKTLNEYEQALFLRPDGMRPVSTAELIRKTELQGEQYDFVSDGEQIIQYPRPFLFAMQGPSNSERSKLTFGERVVCLYDNAGEHFLAGQDSVSAPVTQHLARGDLLLFVFDPTQDPRVRRSVGEKNGADSSKRQLSSRQEIVLLEAASRVRRHRNMSQREKITQPLVVVVTKADVWGDLPEDPWITSNGKPESYIATVERYSAKTRGFLNTSCPELVQAAEGLAKSVTYVPVSALGKPPIVDPATGKASIVPSEIKPCWVSVPFFYGIFKHFTKPR